MTKSGMAGRVALVTGAAGNIGTAICAALSGAGFKVYATDLRDDPVRDLTPLDVSSPKDWERTIAAIESQDGRLDVLVNNAGIAPMGRIEEIDLDEWRRCFEINVESVLLGIQATLALLRRSSEPNALSSIVNVASAAATKPSPMAAAYCSSKAALAMLSRTAAVEFGRLGYGVRVNTVNPGAVESDMMNGIVARYAEILGGVSEQSLFEGIRRDVPLGCMARAEDVAKSVLFLASPASNFIHGTELHVDGGLTA